LQNLGAGFGANLTCYDVWCDRRAWWCVFPKVEIMARSDVLFHDAPPPPNTPSMKAFSEKAQAASQSTLHAVVSVDTMLLKGLQSGVIEVLVWTCTENEQALFLSRLVGSSCS
jgi:hypothetical protein